MKSLKVLALLLVSIFVLGPSVSYAKPEKPNKNEAASKNVNRHPRLKARPITPEMRKAAAERAKARREKEQQDKAAEGNK